MYLEQTLFLAAALGAFLVTRGVIFLKPSPHFQSLVWFLLVLLPLLIISAALAFSSIRIWWQADSFSYRLTWSAGSAEVVSTLFGCIFGIMLAILVDLAVSGEQYLRWGAATAVVLLVGGFYVDVKQGISRLTSLETPIISFQLRLDETEKSDNRVVDPNPDIASFSQLVPFQTGVKNFSRTIPLLERDRILIYILHDDNPNLRDFDDQDLRDFDDTKEVLQYFDTGMCLQDYANAFPEGLPLEEPLVRFSTNLLNLFVGNDTQDKSYKLLHDSLREIRDQALPYTSLPSLCMQKMPDNITELAANKGISELPYTSIVAAHVMVAAGYPRSGAAVLLYWLDRHQTNKSVVGLLSRIRALTELLLILKTDRDYRGATLVLDDLAKSYEEFVPMAFDVNLDDVVPRHGNCSSVELERFKNKEIDRYFKSFVFSAISASRELVEFEAKHHRNRVTISNRELGDRADEILNVEVTCFRDLFGDKEDDETKDTEVARFRVEFLLAYAYAKLALVEARDIVVDEDRVDVRELLRDARAALEEAVNGLSLLKSRSQSGDALATLSARVLNESGTDQLLDEVTNLRSLVISLQRRA